MAVKKTPGTKSQTAARPAAKAGTAKKTAPASAKARPAAGKAFAQSPAQVDRAVAVAKENVAKASQAAFQGYDELAVLGQGNFDALVRSNSVVAKGFEAISKEVLAFAQRSMEGHMAQAQALIAAKDIQEFVDLQNAYAKRRLEDTIAETAKLTELSTQVANEAIEPLKERVDVAVEKVLKAKAA